MSDKLQAPPPKNMVPRDFLLSPEAHSIRSVADSLYPSYLRASLRRGDPAVIEPIPVLDEAFMNSHEGRWVRILAETTYAEFSMQKHKVHHTVVFFGSAQIPEKQTAADGLQKARERADQGQIERWERMLDISQYYDQARELAAKLTAWSLEQGVPGDPQPFVICTGGGPSIMEAGNRGAADVNGKSIGLNIFLPHEQSSNPYISPELDFHFHYFFTRKFHFLYRAKALVVFPGGYGSLDEMFEVLNLIKTRKIVKSMAVVLFGSRFWKRVIDFQYMADCGVIHPDDLEAFSYADTVEEALKRLTRHLQKYLNR
ncbi:LOG family protein [bacterium]|nr:LOG family protein [bacterium]